MRRTVLLALIMMCTIPVSAATDTTDLTQAKSLIIQAMKKVESTSLSHWKYDVSHYENEEGEVTSSLERHEPNVNNANSSNEFNSKWQLLQLNDKTPTKKQIKNYLKEKQTRADNKKQGKGLSISLPEIIDLPSLQLVSQTNVQTEMTFDVVIEQLGDDAIGKLKGRLRYNNQKEFIETITITNSEDFSAMFGSNITELEMVLEFIQMKNSVLPKQNNMILKGTFAYFIEIDEVSSAKYFNYDLTMHTP
mgnify:CR=1 FL=1